MYYVSMQCFYFIFFDDCTVGCLTCRRICYVFLLTAFKLSLLLLVRFAVVTVRILLLFACGLSRVSLESKNPKSSLSSTFLFRVLVILQNGVYYSLVAVGHLSFRILFIITLHLSRSKSRLLEVAKMNLIYTLSLLLFSLSNKKRTNFQM